MVAAHKFQIELGAALSGTFESSLDKGKEKLGLLGQAVRNLDIQSQQATALSKLKAQTDQAKIAWQEAEAQVKGLALEIKQTQQPSAELSQRFQEAKTAAQTAKQAFLEKQKSLDKLKVSLQKTGVDTEKLTARQAKLGSSVVQLKAQYTAMQAVLHKQQALMGKARAAMGSFMRVGITAAATLGIPVKKALDAQEAMVNLGKVTTQIRSEGLGLLRAELEALTQKLPYTFKELADLATMGARIGVRDADLQSWTEVAGKMAMVLGMSTQDMGDALAKLQGAFNLSLHDLESMGDMIDYLGDTSRVATPDLIRGMVDMAGAAQQFGLSVQSIAGFTTAFSKMGYDVQRARSIVTQFLPRLGVVASETNQTLTEAAQKIGILPQKLKQMMQDNPEQALIYALEKINAIPLEDQAGALTRIFGQTVQSEASNLAKHVDVLKETFANLADQTQVNGALQRDYVTLMARSKEQMALFRNAFDRMGIAIGEAVLPSLTALMQQLTGVFNAVSDFGKSHPKILGFLTKGAAALLGIAAAGAALKLVVFGLGGAFLGAKAGVLAAGVALKGLWILMQANPITATISAITVGATLVLKYWQPVKAFFVNFWNWITEKITAIGDFFGKIGSSVGGFFKKLWPFGKAASQENPRQAEGTTAKSLRDLPASLPASAVNSNNKTLTNNMTFHITGGGQDPKDIADQINKAVQESTRDALYDDVYVG